MNPDVSGNSLFLHLVRVALVKASIVGVGPAYSFFGIHVRVALAHCLAEKAESRENSSGRAEMAIVDCPIDTKEEMVANYQPIQGARVRRCRPAVEVAASR